MWYQAPAGPVAAGDLDGDGHVDVVEFDAIPGATMGTATFGKINSADVPRNLQFGLKVIW